MFGFLVINKPQGLTSRSALNLVGKLVKPFKVGHTGTLDPLATGVLVAGIGPATRLTRFVQAMPKKYIGEFRLGFESDSEDIDGEVHPVVDSVEVSASQLKKTLPRFTGKISQIPPRFSALKVDGKRAHELARQGKSFELKPREIEIHNLVLKSFDYPDFKLEVECGSGTYIRSLGRDLGRAVGSGAIMTGLVRTRVDGFSLSKSIDLENLCLKKIQQQLLPPQVAVEHLPTIEISQNEVDGLLDGVPLQDPLGVSEGSQVVALDERERLIVVATKRAGALTPEINFAHYYRK